MTQSPTQSHTRSTAPKTFPCDQCGAELAFAPGQSSLKCEHCGFTTTIESSGSIEEQSYVRGLELVGKNEPTVDVIVVHCDSCGADTHLGENVTSSLCAFCASPVVAQEQSVKIIAPQAVLPFQVPATDAERYFAAWIRSRWFAPSDLRAIARLEGRLAGVYLPFWTYDAKTRTSYRGQRGEHYYVTVNKQRQRRTRWYPAAGVVHNTFDDVLICASKSLPAARIDTLEPWTLGELKPYRHEFLAGFRAESYGITLDDGLKLAADKMEPMIEVTIRADIGGDAQRILSRDIEYLDVSYKHILLPVWIAAYRYRGKLYRIVVNAQTGETTGDRPYSAWKIAFAVLAGLIVAGIIALIASSR